MQISETGLGVEAEEVPTEYDLSDVLGAYRDKSITKTELMYVLVTNVDHDGLLEILVTEFGVKFARKLMLDALRIAKKQARERRLNA